MGKGLVFWYVDVHHITYLNLLLSEDDGGACTRLHLKVHVVGLLVWLQERGAATLKVLCISMSIFCVSISN